MVFILKNAQKIYFGKSGRNNYEQNIFLFYAFLVLHIGQKSEKVQFRESSKAKVFLNIFQTKQPQMSGAELRSEEKGAGD